MKQTYADFSDTIFFKSTFLLDMLPHPSNVWNWVSYFIDFILEYVHVHLAMYCCQKIPFKKVIPKVKEHDIFIVTAKYMSKKSIKFLNLKAFMAFPASRPSFFVSKRFANNAFHQRGGKCIFHSTDR